MRLLILLMAAGLAFAQQPPETKQEPFEAEIIPVKTLTGDSFIRLLKLLDVFGAHVQGDSELRTIVVYAPKDVVAQMRRVVEQLDRPGSEAAMGRNIDMTLTLLHGSTKAAATEAALPPDLEPVARQLRNTTLYKDIQLLDVIPLRLQEGKETSENLRLPTPVATGPVAKGNITIRPEAVYRKDQGRYVRFAHMNLGFSIPYGVGVGTNFSYMDVHLNTSGDFMEGQKTVLGKVSGTGEDDAIFAVIALKVLD